MTKLKIKHKKYGDISYTDGEQLIEMHDGERWKLENIIVLKAKSKESERNEG